MKLDIYQNWSEYLRKWFVIPLLAVSVIAPAVVSAKEKKPFTVVIDAGHGGHDTGACDTGAREKDINLGVALKLGELVEKKMKQAKVVYTRKDDTFVSLQGRADIANREKGDLFISIHTNSLDKSNKNRTTVAGTSVYALGLHKDDNNMAVARRENSVIELESGYKEKYKGFDPSKDESYILFEMAQKKNLSKSIRFAGDVQKNLVNHAGRKDRGVHQAGFWVLWATSMPAVLIELDFICNPVTAKYISSDEGQKRMAEAIFQAVRNYESSSRAVSMAGGMTSCPAADPEEPEKAMALAAVAETDDTESGDAVVISAASTPTLKRGHTAASRKATVAARRRRGAASRAASEAGMTTDAVITLRSESDYEMRVEKAAADHAAALQASYAADNDKEGRKDKKSVKEKKDKKKEKKGGDIRTYRNRQVVMSDSDVRPARRERKENARSRRQQISTVYKIQILASDEKLKQNNVRFQGLEPVSAFRENNLYKYTYGESRNKTDMERLLPEVRKKFPDAFIIRCISGS